MLWDTDQFHGQAFIYIYIHHVFHKNGFRFFMSFPVTTQKLIGNILEQIQVVVLFVDFIGQFLSSGKDFNNLDTLSIDCGVWSVKRL